MLCQALFSIVLPLLGEKKIKKTFPREWSPNQKSIDRAPFTAQVMILSLRWVFSNNRLHLLSTYYIAGHFPKYITWFIRIRLPKISGWELLFPHFTDKKTGSERWSRGHRSIYFILFICAWLCWVFIAAYRLFPSCGELQLLSSCCVKASHCCSFSC